MAAHNLKQAAVAAKKRSVPAPPNKRLYQSVDDAIREYQARKEKRTTDEDDEGSF